MRENQRREEEERLTKRRLTLENELIVLSVASLRRESTRTLFGGDDREGRNEAEDLDDRLSTSVGS